MASPHPVIDIHVHLLAAGPQPHWPEVEEALRHARRWGIQQLVLLGNVTAAGYDPSPQAVRDLNTQTLAVMARHPEACLGFCYLNPAHTPAFIEEEIHRCLVEGGMRGIKLWVAVKATDPRLDPIMARAEALGVPVLHHAWYKATQYAHNESTPAEVAALARRWPRVTLIMAHLGGGGVRGVLDVAGVPNVLIDTSGAQPEAGLVEYAVRRLGPERVVFGSDWIGGRGRDFGTQLGRVLGADIPAEAKALILGGNAARLLRQEVAA